jgi:hypothetical protein
MTPKEKEALEKRICKYLALLSYVELAELKISGQSAMKIKKGEPVHFYSKTIARLRKLVERK